MRRLMDVSRISSHGAARNRRDTAPVMSALLIVLLSIYCAAPAFGQMILVASAEESLQPPAAERIFADAPVRFGMPEVVKALPSFVYPVKAKTFQVEGRVIVHFVLNEKGKATDVQIVKGLGYGCDEEVLRVLRYGRFRPVVDEAGSPQPTRFAVAVDFRLDE